ncbi:MAG: hypothetical protein HOV81_44290 [Kofleriaceae bacterium]|nr:hypothetical protein [Kofleriaceae bacterium]
MPRKKLGEMLVDAGVLSEQGLRAGLAEQRRWGGTLGRTLVDMKLVSEPDLVRALSQQLSLPTIDLDRIEIEPRVLDLVPGELAEEHSLVPFAQPMKFLDVAMTEPTNLGLLDELRIRTQLNIRPYLAGPKMIERALAKHYRRGFTGLRRGEVEVMFDGPDVLADDITGPIDPMDIQAARRREGIVSPPPRVRKQPIDAPDPGSGVIALGDHHPRDAEIDALQRRISTLEALVERDEEVLRKLLALLVEKGVATRDEILERIR